jgi:hypothetical protein
MSSASWRKCLLLNRSAMLSAWPQHFPRHDFHTLHLSRSPLNRADSYWEGESWRIAAQQYHADRKRNMRR